ncbi:MAG TPA: patatin-like phospholipase family protein [Beijerinckiaceae bacterium]|nr:patatin-like phospholipase family protein [Beijerinckiaceae bacterium]
MSTPLPEPKPQPKGPVIGLALGGGVARGWAHIGILRVLEREGIRPKIVTGTSIGAVVGGCWATGYLDQLELFARRLTKRGIFNLMDFSLSGSGLVGGRRLREMLDEALGDRAIENLPTRFAAVATEYGTGHEIWLKRGHLGTAVRASYAIPGVFEPVKVNDKWLLDGALVNPVPVTTARALGATMVIAVNLNNEHFGRSTVISDRVAEPPPAETPDATGRSGLFRPVKDAANAVSYYFNGRPSTPSGTPSIASVMIETINITQDRIARSRLAGDPPDVMIAPKLARIGLFEFHRADEAIALGAEAAERMLPDLREVFDALAARQ